MFIDFKKNKIVVDFIIDLVNCIVEVLSNKILLIIIKVI